MTCGKAHLADVREMGVDVYVRDVCPGCGECNPVHVGAYATAVANMSALPDWRLQQMLAEGDVTDTDLRYIELFRRMSRGI